MKKLNKLKLVAVAVVVGTMLTTLGAQAASSRGFFVAKKMKIYGLDKDFSGKMVSVFHVSGRPPTFSTQGALPSVYQVLHIGGPYQILRDRNCDPSQNCESQPVEIPTTRFKRPNGFGSYKFLFFVVHSPYQNHVAICNSKGTIPRGQEWLPDGGDKAIGFQYGDRCTDNKFKSMGSSSPFNHSYQFWRSVEDVKKAYDNKARETVLRINVPPAHLRTRIHR